MGVFYDLLNKQQPLKKSFTFSEIMKYNPYHDRLGRFASASIASRGSDGSITYAGTMSPNRKLTEKLAKETVSRATEAEKKLTADISKYANAAGATMEGLEYAVKGEGSLNRKLITEQKENNVSPKEALSKMYDVNRYTMIHDADNLADAAKSVMSNLENDGYQVMRIKNTLGDESKSYRGMNTVIKSPEGTYFELQFHTKQSLEIKEVNHKLYEEQRLDSTSRERKVELGNIMRDNLQKLVTPTNINDIESFNNL